MMVKICGITDADDALAAAESGASAIGFNFYRPSPRYVEPALAAAIGAALPAGVWKAGIFVNETAETADRVAREAGLDIVQLYGGAAPAGVRVWRAFKVDPDWRRQPDEESVEAVLLDSPAPGSGASFDWRIACEIVEQGVQVVLAGGLDADNVGRAIAAVRPWGVDACSRLESAPGRKDRARMAAFIRAALS
jgi:phosphoribosylanthranilate isomerase